MIKFFDDIDVPLVLDDIKVRREGDDDRKLRIRATVSMDDHLASELPSWAQDAWALMRDASAEAVEIKLANKVELQRLALHISETGSGSRRATVVSPTTVEDVAFQRKKGEAILRFRFGAEMTSSLWDFLFRALTFEVRASFTCAQMELPMQPGAQPGAAPIQ